MLTAIIVLIVFSVLVVIHEAGHLIAAKRFGIGVEVFSVGMGKKLFGVKVGGTEYRVSLFPIGGYCKMAGEDPNEAKGMEHELGSKPPGHRFWVMVAGSLTNYVFAFILFSVIFMMGVPTLSNKVGELLQGYPAQSAGIVKGDRIVEINGMKIKYWDDVLLAIKEGSSKETPLNIKLERNASMLDLKVQPKISEMTNIFGQKISRPMLGIGPENEILSVSYGPVKAIQLGGEKLIETTVMTYKMIWLVLTGGVQVKDSLSGPIGIVYFIKEAAHMGMIPLLIITAHLSLALAIFNLLPFPVLDGGHVIFLLIEKLRGKPISIRAQEAITNVALVFLITFAVFVSWQDVKRFTPVGKMKAFNQEAVPEKEAAPAVNK